MYKRLAIAIIFPAMAASWKVDHPRRPNVSSSPLCHTDGDDLFLQLEEEELRSFASINTLCPVLIPSIPQRKLAFLANPFQSEHMTMKDAIMYLKCLFARGIKFVQHKTWIFVKEIVKLIIATLYLCNPNTLWEFIQQPFPFANHILPDGVVLSNAMVLCMIGFVVTVSFTLGLYQSTLGKLRQQDSICVQEQAELEKKEFEKQNKLLEAASTTQSVETESVDALVNFYKAAKEECISMEQSMKQQQQEEKMEKESREEEPIDNDSTVISGLTTDQSTLIASPPGTPARVTFDTTTTQLQSPSTPIQKEKKNKGSLTPKSPRRKMRNPFKRKKNKITAE